MRIQIMSKELGHQELVCLEKREFEGTLADMDELQRQKWIIVGKMKDGSQQLLSQKEAVKQFDKLETCLVRPPLVGG